MTRKFQDYSKEISRCHQDYDKKWMSPRILWVSPRLFHEKFQDYNKKNPRLFQELKMLPKKMSTRLWQEMDGTKIISWKFQDYKDITKIKIKENSKILRMSPRLWHKICHQDCAKI